MIERKFADGGAADFRKVRTAAELLAHVVGKGANVGAGRALDDEASDGPFDFGEAIFEEFDGGRFKFDGLILAGEFVGGTPSDFLGGKNRRQLLEAAQGLVGESLELDAIEINGNFGRLRSALGVVSIGGVAETESSGVALATAGVEADKARGFAKEKDEHAGGKRVECAEMADLAEPGKMADRVDDIVRRFALRLVDDERAIEGRRLWLAGHGK